MFRAAHGGAKCWRFRILLRVPLLRQGRRLQEEKTRDEKGIPYDEAIRANDPFEVSDMFVLLSG